MAQNKNCWSPEKGIWEELKQLCKEATWACVPLDKRRKDSIPSDTGVYLMCVRPPVPELKAIKLYTVIYTGKTEERGLRTRFLEHAKNPTDRLRAFIKCYDNKVDFWYFVTDKENIGQMEKWLYEAFRPPCNVISPPSSPAIKARLGQFRTINTKY